MDFLRSTINAGRCDALMSMPAHDNRLATTRPWYRTGYAAVSRRQAEAISRLDDPGLQHLTIGLPAGVTPVSVTLMHHDLASNMRPYSNFSQQALVKDVADGKVDLAILWGPFGGWLAQEQGVKASLLQQSPGEPSFTLDMSVGVRRNDSALHDMLNEALDRNRAEIVAILDRWHVPRAEK
jgi:mxaJ protein